MQPPSGLKTTITILLIALCAFVTKSLAKRSNAEVLEDIKKYDKCVLKSVFSFIYTDYNPPRTSADFERMCKRHSEGIKCLREQTKGSEPLIRRGLVTLAGTRSRQSKRLCANSNSEQAKKFVAATKCLMDKRADQLKELDRVFFKSVASILVRNYNDSAPELKQLCCALHDFKQGSINVGSAACPEHRVMIEEFMDMMVTDETTIVCDDEEKLNKSCPKLERLPIDKIPDSSFDGTNTKIPNAAVTIMYLFATLGEPSQAPIRLD